MLQILGKQHRFCDQVSRRSFLKIGGLAMGGLTLPELLRAEAQAGTGRSRKAVIMIFLSGGAPHQDMYDLKMDAPAEIRGEFKPIDTAVPGIQICEHLPLMAKMMDRLAPIRSIVGSEGRHAAFQCMTGRSVKSQPEPVETRLRAAAFRGRSGLRHRPRSLAVSRTRQTPHRRGL